MKYLLSIFLIFITNFATAQLYLETEKSFFLPDNQIDDIQVHPIQNDQFLIVNFQTFRSKKNNNYAISKLDSNLQVLWNVDLPIEPKFIERYSYSDAQNLYLLLSEEFSKKNLLLTISLIDGKSTQHLFETLTVFKLTQFSVFEENVFLQGEYRDKSIIEIYDLNHKTTKVLPELYAKNKGVKYHWINNVRKEIYVFEEDKKNCSLSLLVYDGFGKYLYKKPLNNKKNRFLEYSIFLGSDGEPFIKGTYGRSCSELSEGFFFGSLDFISEIEYQPYSSLSSFVEGLSEKKREKLLIRKAAGKKNPMVYKTILNDFLKLENVLVVEMYEIENENDRYFKSTPSVLKKKLIVSEIQNNYKNFVTILNNVSYDTIKASIAVLLEKNNYYVIYIQDNDLYTITNKKNKPIKTEIVSKEINTIYSPKFDILSSSAGKLYIHGSAYLSSGNQQNLKSEEYYFIKRFGIN